MSIVKLNNNGVKNATAFGSITGLGSMVFIKKLTASSSATLSFVDGASSVVLDNTYKEYLFTFNNIHPATDDVGFMFNLSTDGGSNYNVTKTTTYFNAFHNESDSLTSLQYSGSYDLAQSTGNQYLANDSVGNDNDQCASGFLHLFNPSSTTFVKHFIARVNHTHENQFTVDQNIAGYANTTSAVDGVRFSMESGNIDSGDICLYGIA
jgi:hypothetical protein